MIRLIVLKEIRAGLLSLRFGLAFALMVVLFAANGAIFVGAYAEKTHLYREGEIKAAEDLREACKELSRMALHRQTRALSPRATGFVSEGFEKYLPCAVGVNAFRTFDPEGGGQGNFLYPRFADLDWTFVVRIVLSLAVMLMTYDGV